MNWFSTLEVKTSQPISHFTGHHRDQQKPVKKGILRQLCWISPLLPALRSDAFFSFRPYFTILLSISQWCRVIHIAGSILMAFSSILNDMMKLCIYFRKCTAKLRLWLYYETLTLRYSGFDFLDHTARLIRTYLETVHLDVPGSWLEIILYDVEFLKIIIYSLIKVIKIHKIMQHKAATYIFTSISKK